jgi:N-acetylmuramoyl-L-alanine amidase
MNTDEHGCENRKFRYRRLSVFICSSILFGCSPAKPPTVTNEKPPMPLEEAMRLIDERAEWTAHPSINIPRHPAEKFLKDITIVIDPGHGGEDGGANSTRPRGYKAGRAGEKEAFMNLRVSLLLQRLLVDAGAHVIMTREGDDTIGLTERAQIANEAVRRRDGGVGADLFVSIHHNAGGGPSANYTSVWYHGSVDDNEPDIDVARTVALRLGDAMRTQVAKTSPIFSSQLMYDGGFGVLRACEVPAVLCECSFYTDPAEERRLRDAGYNLREAYAIYLGLCDWAYCGRPTQTTPVITSAGGELQMTCALDEGLPAWWGVDRSRILRSSVQVKLDDQVMPVQFDELSRQISVRLPSMAGSGEHVVAVRHANMFKNHNWPQRYQLKRGSTGSVTAEPIGARRPRSQPATRPASRPTTRR